jgi:Undecaprenyl-phosphate glucose phosphotransferase
MSTTRKLRRIEGETLSSSRQVPNANKYSRTRWMAFVGFVEFFVIFVASYIASVVYHVSVYGKFSQANLYLVFSFVLGAFYVLACLIDNQYDSLGEKWRKDGISRAVVAIVSAFSVFLSLVFIFEWGHYFSRGTLLTQLVFVTVAIILVRVILVQRFERAAQSGRLQSLGIVVISFATSDNLGNYISRLCSASDEIVRSYDINVRQTSSEKIRSQAVADKIKQIRNECRKPGVDLVVVIYDAMNRTDAVKVVEAFYELPLRIRLLPIGMTPFMQRSRVIETGQFPTLEISTQPFSLFDRFLKRAFDLAVAIPALVLFSPLLLLVAIAIKLDSSGSVLFQQIRHGLNNEPIEVLKFRTMKMQKAQGQFQQTMKDDPRVTRIGRLLRRTNIDELPQLFNVLRGEMSIVGPRPHATVHNDMYANQIKMMYRRHNVKPGITGWAQVNGLRGATDTCDKMRRRIEYDLYYVDHWSIFFDIKILLMTILSKKAYMNAF